MPSNAIFKVPTPVNEPIRSYAPGSGDPGSGDAQRKSLKAMLKKMGGETIDIPCIIGGREVRTGNKRKVEVNPDKASPDRVSKRKAEANLAGPTKVSGAPKAVPEPRSRRAVKTRLRKTTGVATWGIGATTAVGRSAPPTTT